MGQRLSIVFYIFALGATVAAIALIKGIRFLENINRLSNDSIYTAASSWDIPVFIGLPCFVALIIALFLRLIDQDKDS
ncbi:MAG: putative membrane protein [Flavobacteriales bacterium]